MDKRLLSSEVIRKDDEWYLINTVENQVQFHTGAAAVGVSATVSVGAALADGSAAAVVAWSSSQLANSSDTSFSARSTYETRF